MSSLTDYADWAQEVVLSQRPHERILTDWKPSWGKTLKAIKEADGLFELFSTIIARWEFLGGLYLGTTSDTNYYQAVQYASKFLEPYYQNYQRIHDMTGRGGNGSEFFSILRNKPFHGGTPSAIAKNGNTEVIGWWIGSDSDTQRYHLEIHKDVIYVDSDKFLSEFLDSLDHFSEYLQEDNDIQNNLKPSIRWYSGFWARFKPLYLPKDIWRNEGAIRGIF